MSLKFEELIPLMSFAMHQTSAPLTNITMVDLRPARDGYIAKPLTLLSEAPNYRLQLVDKVTAAEVIVWLRFPDGMADDTLNWTVIEERTVNWLENIRKLAQSQLKCELGYLSHDDSVFSLFASSRPKQGTAEHAAYLMISAFKRRISEERTSPRASVECYEAAAGRRYRVSAYMGNGFSFAVEPLVSGEKPSDFSLYGTCTIKGASYRCEISHSVLREQLPIYYGAEQLQNLIREHMWRYAGEWHAALANGDFEFDFEGVTK